MKTMRLLSSSTKRSNTAVASSPSRVPESFLETFNALPHLENVDPLTLSENPRDRLQYEDFFDSIMNRCNSFPLYEAFEPLLIKFFKAERAILWENRPNLRDFHSRRLKKEVSISNPIIDLIVSKKKNCIIYDDFKDSQLAQQFVTNPDLPQLFFSIEINNGSIIAIIQLTRSTTSLPTLFDSTDEQKAKFISRKFLIYGSASFVHPQTISSASELSRYGNLKATADFIINSIQTSFSCSNVDFWFFNEKMNLFSRYERNSGFVNIYRCTSGIIGAVLRNGDTVNEASCQQHQNYLQAIDGDPENPILIVSCKFDDKTWACALRGPRTGYALSYSGEEEKHLSALFPFIVRSLAYSAQLSPPPPTPIDRIEEKVGNTLDSAASFSSSMDIKQLTENIESRFKYVIDCESVRLLIVSKNQREFSNGEKTFPVNIGISGLTYSSLKASVYSNPEDERGFNSDLDSPKTKTKIRTLLSYPIVINYIGSNSNNSPSKNRSDSSPTFCIAVINFFNKKSGDQFNSTDVDKINSISHFCAHSIQNAISYQSVIGVTNHLRVFMHASKQVLLLSSAKKALQEILNSAKEIFSASRVTLFMRNPKGSEKPLYEFLSVDDNNENRQHKRQQNTRNAEEAIKKKETVKVHLGSLLICTTPLFDHHMNVLGAMEIGAQENKGRVEEATLIESFATIAAISLERLKLEKLAEIGHVHNSFKKLLSEEERESFVTPKVLKETKNIFTFDFDINDDRIDQTEMLKIVFAAFDKYDMKKQFHITNQKLFLFIIDISKTYKKNGLHTWKHSIDVLQFVIFVLSSTSLHQSFEKYELFALIIASICHDAGHDEFVGQKTKNDRSRVPFQLLYRSQSVEEMLNVECAIRTMSKDECNLLSRLEYEQQKRIWRLVIDLILGTNFRKHFKLMQAIEEKNELDLASKKDRMTLLVLLMKCADLSCLTRGNFESVQKRASGIVHEFLMVGKVEKCGGLKYSDDGSGGKKLNEERSIAGVLKSVAVPAFEKLLTVSEKVEPVFESLKKNIDEIDAIVKEKYKEEEEKERREEEERKRKEEEERKRKEEEERKRKEEEERRRKEEEERKRREEEERKRKEEEERKRKEEEERKKKEEEERKRKEEEERKRKEEEEERKRKEEEERKRKEEEERIKKEEEERKRKEEEEERIKKEEEERKKKEEEELEKRKNSQIETSSDDENNGANSKHVNDQDDDIPRVPFVDEPASDEGGDDDDDDD